MTPISPSTTRHPWGTILTASLLAVLLTAAAPAIASAPTEPATSSKPTGNSLPPGPSIKEVLSLDEVAGPRIAADGSIIAYSVWRTDWEANRYDREIYLARPGEEPFELTRTEDGSSTNPELSPDGRRLAFLADRGDKTQLHLIRTGGGEALALTAIKEDIGDFKWSPDGRFLALVLQEPESEAEEKRQELYGDFAVEDEEYRLSHLWLLDVDAALAADGGVERPDAQDAEDESAEDDGKGEDHEGDDEDGETEAEPLRRLTGGDGLVGDRFTVDSFAFSPDGREIAFSHRPKPFVTSWPESDISVVEVESGTVRPLVTRHGADSSPLYSPDGTSILFRTTNGETAYYKNDELARIPADGGEIEILTASFDEDPSPVAWTERGIVFLALERTRRKIFFLDPESLEIGALDIDPPWIDSVDVSTDGRTFALAGFDSTTMDEIYRLEAGESPRALTAMSERLAGWPEPTTELVTWKSRDNTEIEGVLVKPDGWEPGERRPLLVVIHGGPAWLSMPRRIYGYVYPVEQWLAKGAVVLLPNYRGSTGYGEAFRAKNVRNLGVGDAWDVLSGVNHLIELGIADPAKIGAMGWSQGGYISAYLATTSGQFQAFSVGAGISDWTTYYVNTDIHPFTRHYLEATPWDDPEIYALTSPMHYIRQARTPTLIQHGENDRRVPIPNAYALYQGLEDMGVPAKLIVYKDFGHGITRPKERLAAVWHNWQWFAKYLWGEDVSMPVE